MERQSVRDRSPRLSPDLLSLLFLAALFCEISPVYSQQEANRESEVRGVNPADNLTKFEILPKLTVLDDALGISIFTTTVKYDRAIRGRYGLNFELPLARFESPFGSVNGNGDFNARARIQFNRARWVTIAGVEAVLPVASDDVLGSGKWQTNPIVAVVYGFSPRVFLAGIAKHLFSVAGDEDREDIVRGQYRLLLAYSSPHGWWALADPQYFVDYEHGERNDLVLEGEFGKMIGPTTGAWVRGGGHLGGNWTQSEWSVSGGLRFLMF